MKINRQNTLFDSTIHVLARVLFLVWICILCLTSEARSEVKRTFDVNEIKANKITILQSTGASVIKPQEVSTLTLKPTQLIFERAAKTGTVISINKTIARIDVPFRLYGVNSTGTNMDMHVVLDVEGGGLIPNAERPEFLGRLHLGILDKINPSSREVLPVPVDFLLTAEEGSDISPSSTQLTHLNLPFTKLLMTTATAKDSVLLHIKPSFSPTEPVDLQISVIRPALSITSSLPSILGLGLEEAAITVTVSGMLQPAGTHVVVGASRGHLKNNSIILTADGSGTTQIRSAYVGATNITARSTVLKPAEMSMDFVFPWWYFVAVLGGSIIGAFVTAFVRERRYFLPFLFIGIFCAIAAALGVNASGIEALNQLLTQVGEAAGFVVASLTSGSIGLKELIAGGKKQETT